MWTVCPGPKGMAITLILTFHLQRQNVPTTRQTLWSVVESQALTHHIAFSIHLTKMASVDSIMAMTDLVLVLEVLGDSLDKLSDRSDPRPDYQPGRQSSDASHPAKTKVAGGDDALRSHQMTYECGFGYDPTDISRDTKEILPLLVYSIPPQHLRTSPHAIREQTAHAKAIAFLNSRPKPQCWEHGCNGRQFSTYSDLLRHQREKSGRPPS